MLGDTLSMSHLVKHRHSAETGYARGGETRARIVLTALKLFGERGFEGASTRDIARAAGVNPPALQYYFDSKEGVYLACVDHILVLLWEYLSGVVGEAERLLEGGANDAALIEAYCAIQHQIAEFMCTAPATSDWRLFLARQQAGMGLEAGFELIQQRFNKRMSAVTSAIVGRLLGRPPGDDETLIRATALGGQLAVFQVTRRSVLAALNWDSIDAARLAKLKRIVREQTIALLQSMVVTRDSVRRASKKGPSSLSRGRAQRRGVG